MKNRLSILLPSFLLLILSSCKKEENKIYYEGGTAPALSASSSAVTLEPGQETTTALTLKWSSSDYKFTTGPSSHNVAYTIEFDTLGGNFKSSIKKSDNAGTSVSKTYTVGELNGILGNDMQLQLSPRRNYTIQARVTSSIPVSGGGSFFKLPSNVISFTTKPFAPPPKIAPPASGKLYITGSATAGNWMGGGDPELVSQRFTQLSPTLYQITIPLTGGASYTFVPVYGDWNSKYSIAKKNDPNEIYGGDFQVGGEDILAPPTTGNYKITVDFQLGKFTVVKL
jgi:starch-binding outer membrane protein SusE/F